MSEDNQLQPTVGFQPPEKIKAEIGIMLTKKHGNVQGALNALKTAEVTEENLEESQQVLRNVNGYLKSGEDMRKDMKEPALNYGRLIDSTFKEYFAPFEAAKAEFQAKVNAVALKKSERIAKEQAEKQKQIDISNAINQFILDKSVEIAAATTNEQLLSIERLINLEKANKSKYDTQLPLLIERSNELTAKIKEQKDLIKQKEEVEKAKMEAEKKGDDEKLQELEQKSAAIDDKIADNTIKVQENAANSLVNTNQEEDTDNSPKARRTVWKAEISDMKEAVKKSMHLLDVSLNTEKIRESITTLKGAGTFTGKKEVIINGIRYFEEKTF